jgi:hypothetical protein
MLGSSTWMRRGEEPVLTHSMQVANLLSLFGDLQRWLVSVTEEKGVRFLNLAPDSATLGKMGYDSMKVKRQRLPDNRATSPPESEG